MFHISRLSQLLNVALNEYVFPTMLNDFFNLENNTGLVFSSINQSLHEAAMSRLIKWSNEKILIHFEFLDKVKLLWNRSDYDDLFYTMISQLDFHIQVNMHTYSVHAYTQRLDGAYSIHLAEQTHSFKSCKWESHKHKQSNSNWAALPNQS